MVCLDSTKTDGQGNQYVIFDYILRLISLQVPIPIRQSEDRRTIVQSSPYGLIKMWLLPEHGGDKVTSVRLGVSSWFRVLLKVNVQASASFCSGASSGTMCVQ